MMAVWMILIILLIVSWMIGIENGIKTPLMICIESGIKKGIVTGSGMVIAMILWE